MRGVPRGHSRKDNLNWLRVCVRLAGYKKAKTSSSSEKRNEHIPASQRTSHGTNDFTDPVEDPRKLIFKQEYRYFKGPQCVDARRN